jgi:hypothetical protein
MQDNRFARYEKIKQTLVLLKFTDNLNIDSVDLV